MASTRHNSNKSWAAQASGERKKIAPVYDNLVELEPDSALIPVKGYRVACKSCLEPLLEMDLCPGIPILNSRSDFCLRGVFGFAKLCNF